MATKTSSSQILHEGAALSVTLDKSKPLSDYTALRAYTGSASQVRITNNGIAGFFYRDDADTSSVDNGGTVIVSINNKRWKRVYDNEIDIRWFQVSGNGTDDDTSKVQAAFDLTGIVYIPTGQYLLSPINIKSNTTLKFSPGVVFIAKSGYNWSDCLLNIDNKTNINIHGNGCKIKLKRSEYPLQENINGSVINSEYRHCVKIYGSSEVRIYDLVCQDAGGDGFTIGGPSVCRNIYLHNCIGDNNRRQGVSVTNGIGVWINGGEYKNTNGLAPGRGIDIEPNPLAGYYIQNIHVTNVITRNNAGGSVLVSPALPAGYNEPVSVYVTNCTSIEDGYSTGISFSAVPGVNMTQPCGGTIIFENCVAIRPAGNGFRSNRWNNFSPRLLVKNLTVVNAGFNPPDSLVINKAAFVFRTEPNETVGNYYGNFELHNLSVYDDTNPGGAANTYYPIYINNANYANEGISDVLIKNIKLYKVAATWGGGSNYPTLLSQTPLSNYRVEYDDPITYPAATSTMPLHAIGTTYVATTASTITLPAASSASGSTYLFRSDADVNLYILPAVGETIDGYSAFPGAGIIARKKGAHIALTSNGVSWRASKINGQWATSNLTPDRYPSSKSAAAPTTGTWEAGDTIMNSVLSNGSPAGWRCLAGGTPGTWIPFGQIGALSSIASTPQFTMQIAVVGGIGYMAVGTSSAADWKQITN